MMVFPQNRRYSSRVSIYTFWESTTNFQTAILIAMRSYPTRSSYTAWNLWHSVWETRLMGTWRPGPFKDPEEPSSAFLLTFRALATVCIMDTLVQVTDSWVNADTSKRLLEGQKYWDGSSDSPLYVQHVVWIQLAIWGTVGASVFYLVAFRFFNKSYRNLSPTNGQTLWAIYHKNQ